MNIRFYKKKIYELALIQPKPGTEFSDCRWVVSKIRNPWFKTKWFADPFILDYDDKTATLLVEEMDFKVNRGRIARLTVDRASNTITEVKILLDLPTHLSFPAIKRTEEETFVYPENSASGKLTIYKYDREADALKAAETLINDPLTDTIQREYDGQSYLFSTKIPNPNGNILNIYKKEGAEYWEFQTVRFSDNTARGAGDWYYEGDRLVRPAQDCNGYYGIGLVFHEVKFQDNKFQFNEINRIKHPKSYDGMHTFNKYGELCVIDYRRPLYPWIYYPLMYIKNLIGKFI